MPVPSSDHNQTDNSWKSQAPYKQPSKEPPFTAVHIGHCHCGRIKFQIGRDAPLDAKLCHCRTCQVLHGAPFQWAAILHKEDMRFVHGVIGLKFYSSGRNVAEHELPCKVSCAYCGSPIMDEGRNMALIFPELIEFKDEEQMGKFAARCHMFYKERVVDIQDDLPKWAGMPKESELMRVGSSL
ncbi:hypothetical protein OIDMADRAFT_19664 [Oidiodendron maius Zn]|uniref:CENP-V/GFA domain-containing protein n=1 Tax=Oidiodendron maius (strain Zn) TaxID=913774 RepID=A0A0C3GTY3_OIDMZ|nr:hypothetical protein OIDMADRAFT_19664 [Oidiodendron maius Zn]